MADWQALLAREAHRYEDGSARRSPEQLVRLGNAAYGAGLVALMLGERAEAAEWLARAGEAWRESFEHATPTSWGRPIGALKASLLAGADADAEAFARWALTLGCAEAESPIGRYAAVLALLVLGRDAEAGALCPSLAGRADFPGAVAETLACLAAGDAGGTAAALAEVLGSFEAREAYLEDVPVADTVLALQALARRRGLARPLPASGLLPAP